MVAWKSLQVSSGWTVEANANSEKKRMRRVFRKLAIGISILTCVYFFKVNSVSARAKNSIVMVTKIPAFFKHDDENSDPSKSVNHFVADSNSEIDLLSTEPDAGFYLQAKLTGEKELYGQIKSAKNRIQALISSSELTVSNFSKTENDSILAVKFETNYEVNRKKYFTKNLYYLSANGSQMLTLKWTEDSDAKQVAKALRAFSEIKFEPVEVTW